MSDAGLIAIGVLTLLVWLFGYIPFICFHLLRFYNFRNDITLSKRYPKITLLTVISLTLWILLFLLEIIRYFFGGPLALEEIFDFINIIIGFIFACSILWRFWLSYYDIQFSIAASSREWQKFINTDAQFDNWYFKKKKTYGDYRWTKKRLIIGTIILIIIYIIISFPDFLAALRFLFVLIPWIALLIIYCKTPTFYDEFAIRLEMKRIIILYSSVLIGYLAVIILIFIIASASNITPTLSAALVAVAVNFLALILFLIAHTMTYWVLKTVDVGFDENGDPIRAPLNPWGHNKKRSHLPKASASGFENFDENVHKASAPSMSGSKQDDRDNTEASSEHGSQGFSMTSSVPHSSKFEIKEKKYRISLSTMFTDIKYLNELFAHLSREFSMECLLAMIEFIQLQQYILLHMQQYKNFYFKQFPNLKIKNNVSLPNGIPRSTIIYGNQNEELVEKYLYNESGRIISIMEREQVRVRLISYQLYAKYAAIGSEWEINISYETRGRLTAKLHNFNEWMSGNKKNIQMWELLQLFEDSKHEMYRLLRHSFARFKRHDDFEKIRNYYNKKIEEEIKREEINKNNKNNNKKNIKLTDYTRLNGGESAEINIKHHHQIKPSSDVVEEPMVDATDIIADLRNDDNE